MKRTSIVLLATACIVVGAVSAHAQDGTQTRMVMPVMDSTQMASALARSMRQLQPAVVVLGYRNELALTPEQVSYLETLVIAQKDSQAVRQARMVMRMREQSKDRTMAAAVPSFSWTGTIDEAALREQACAQAALSVDSTIGLLSDRHAVGAVLTPEQLARLPKLEMQSLMASMKRP
ncbi:MAG: hypothetical protein JWM95_991 [Gemmatimonadetes bacterium]|nr:hypothetical protein [Gemmatimonadota bacterium]